MTEQIQRKLSESKTARWSVLALVAFTMLCGYFITDMMAPLQDLLQTPVEGGGLGWTANEYGKFTSAYGWFNVFFLMLIFGFWFVTEVSCQIVYGDIDRVFHIEENIRKLKDSNGQYLWQLALHEGGFDTLLGKRIYTSPYAPELAAGQKTVAFGDFNYYWIGDRLGITFKRLNERFAETGQIGFIASQRLDGKLILPEAIKVLQQKGTASSGT